MVSVPTGAYGSRGAPASAAPDSGHRGARSASPLASGAPGSSDFPQSPEPSAPFGTPDGTSADVALLRTIRTCLVILVIAAIGVVFYFGKDIVMPIALGLLITLTLTPPVRWLRRLGLPAGVAAILVVLSVGGAIGAGTWFLSAPVSELLESAPRIGERIEARMRDVESTVGSIGEISDQVDEIADDGDGAQVVAIEQPGLVSSATSSLAGGLTSTAVALVFALFMLGSGDLFYEKLVAVMPRLREKKRALKIVRDVEDNVSRYLFTITLINASLGLVIGTLLFLYGMPGAVLWGVIAAVANFLPFVGAVFGAGLLGAMALGHYDGLLAALVPPAIYLACSTIEGNVVTPLIVGRRLKLNVVAVFLAVAVWGWLWGIAGALMAVPLLVVFKVLCDYVEGLTSWGEFLAGRREISVD